MYKVSGRDMGIGGRCDGRCEGCGSEKEMADESLELNGMFGKLCGALPHISSHAAVAPFRRTDAPAPRHCLQHTDNTCRTGTASHILLKSRPRARQAARPPARHGTTVSIIHHASYPPIPYLTTPSSVQTMQQYMQPALNALRNPTSLLQRVSSEASNTTPQNVLAQLRGMSNAQWASIGIVAAEVIGFFSVGEIIGRFKLVGYRAKEHAEH